ncbi:hypothetical protein AVEN_47188-1 [Araneus ventricosus]|uniref:Uncharacterized protein n=1 Tax=Araneus ventricosus TaxID=182803 RepID=A0A4Y2EFX3_ARAVE|nr:hypothetical protein AVEN_47188-1 [Araneus ventricosus]
MRPLHGNTLLVLCNQLQYPAQEEGSWSPTKPRLYRQLYIIISSEPTNIQLLIQRAENLVVRWRQIRAIRRLGWLGDIMQPTSWQFVSNFGPNQSKEGDPKCKLDFPHYATKLNTKRAVICNKWANLRNVSYCGHIGPHIRMVFSSNRVSSLDPSNFEIESIPRVHSGLLNLPCMWVWRKLNLLPMAKRHLSGMVCKSEEGSPTQELVILTSRFEVTRGLFWDGPLNFEPRSDDEYDNRAGTTPALPVHPCGLETLWVSRWTWVMGTTPRKLGRCV